MYRIGELSQLSQVAVRTLRFYDQIGLLVPAHVASSGYRCYAAEQFERLNRILVLKDLGLSLDEIRQLLGDHASVADLRALVERKHAELERRVETERQRLSQIAARLALLDRDGTAGDAPADIAVRTTGAQWIASIRETVSSHDECDRLHDELAHHLRQPRRQLGAIWHVCTTALDERSPAKRGARVAGGNPPRPPGIDCEAFALLPGPIAPTRRVCVRQLPAQRVAALIYRGDTDYLPAYRALRAWIDCSGLAIAGPKRELFLRGAASVTEVQFPIARRRAHPRSPR
jgi:DNA-binding transcriptional MerR regulator